MMDSKTIDLPKSWAVVKLGDFVENDKGKKPKNESTSKTDSHLMPYVDIQAFEENVIRSWTDGVGCRLCSETDFLMVWDGSRSGLVGKGINGALGSTLVRINFPSMVNDYAYYFLQSKYQQINTRAKGSGTPHVDPDLLWNYDFPIPPLPEQHRIVTKIEELFSELDKGIESFKTAREQLKVYRQALLKHAFEGKLTAAWREENKDKLESADALLKRIQTERAERYRQQVKEWEKEVKEWEKSGKQGSKPGKPSQPKELPPLTAVELAELPELPKGWGWVKLGHIQSDNKHAVKAGPFGSALKKEFYVANGYKIYGQEQVISGDSEYGNYFVDEKKYQELLSCAVKANDILISLVGTIGKVLILPESAKPGIINPRLVKISLNLNRYRPSFFKAYFESSFLKSLYANESQGTTMDILNLGMIQNLPYPFCAKEEQEQILQELESRLSEVEQLDQTITTALQQAETLRQSILKKAFSGQLVPQDPKDEPASVLLARIKTERATVKQNSKGGRVTDRAPTKTPRKKVTK